MKPIHVDVANQGSLCQFMRLSQELSAVFHHRHNNLPAGISSLASCQHVACNFLYIPFIFNQLLSSTNHFTVTIINSCKILSSHCFACSAGARSFLQTMR
jgi:hypothetical protein